MTDQHVTASTVIAFAEELEEATGRFYQELAERFPAQQELFQGYAKQCAKDKVLVTRTYQETVSDALETNYAFTGLKLDSHLADTTLAQGADLPAALDRAVALEGQAQAFYEEVAERSQALLATIPRAFRRVAQRRASRMDELATLRASQSA